MAFDAFGEGRTRKPVRCVIYTRQSVSTSDALSSCAIQREACAVFAASQGWIVENGRFDDVGFPGVTLDRPGLQRLLALLREDRADHILVHRLDRLSRRVADCVKLLDEFRRRVNLVIVTAPELGNAAQDRFLLNIMASFAEFEREMIAGRIAEARARLKWERKRLAGAVPYGDNANPRTRQFEPAAAEAEVVRWMFAEAATGKRHQKSLARRTRISIEPRRMGPGAHVRLWRRYATPSTRAISESAQAQRLCGRLAAERQDPLRAVWSAVVAAQLPARQQGLLAIIGAGPLPEAGIRAGIRFRPGTSSR